MLHARIVAGCIGLRANAAARSRTILRHVAVQLSIHATSPRTEKLTSTRWFEERNSFIAAADVHVADAGYALLDVASVMTRAVTTLLVSGLFFQSVFNMKSAILVTG